MISFLFIQKLKNLIIEERDATESVIIRFVIKPNFDTVWDSIIEISDGWEIDCTQNETITRSIRI